MSYLKRKTILYQDQHAIINASNWSESMVNQQKALIIHKYYQKLTHK